MRRTGLAAAGALFTLAFASTASAGEKKFGYTYEPQVLPPGGVELELWVTPRLGKAAGVYSRFDVRAEVEVGLVEDLLQTSLYLNLRNTRVAEARAGRRRAFPLLESDGKTTFSELEFEGVSSEWILKLLDPVADPVGLALYVEAGTNGQEFELEEKLILAKTWGPITLAVNLYVEQEWRVKSDESPRELTVGATAGLACKIPDTGFSIGVELRSEHVLDRFEDYEHAVTSLGPVLHYARDKWWFTLTAFPQIASPTPTHKVFDYDGYEAFEVRLIVGVEF